MSRYTHTDKQSGDGLAITDWNNLSSAVAGSSGLTLALNSAHKVGVGTPAPDGACKLDVNGVAKATALSISGDGSEDVPDGSLNVTHDCILFGGRNQGKPRNSAQISAGKHAANSLCIVGMSSGQSETDRRVNMWAEAGFTVAGSVSSSGTVSSKGLRIDNQVSAHIEVDGALYRMGNQVYLTVDDNLYIRDQSQGAGSKFHFDTNNSRLAIGGVTPEAPLSISGDGKETSPNASMHITNDCILFGGNNNGRQTDSAQISAGRHAADTLCIVGMSNPAGERKVKIWAEGGVDVVGGVTASRFVGDGSGLSNVGINFQGFGSKLRFDTNNGRLGVGGVTPGAPLSISGDGKESQPDSSMHITKDCILFGGRNAGQEANSAQISAGKHIANSLCIVGMSNLQPYSLLNRQVDIWAELGLTLHGGLADNTCRIKVEDDKLVFAMAKSYHGPNRAISWDGDTNWDAVSDRKLKINIEAEEGILDRLLQLEVKRYQWKDAGEKDPSKIGFVAQDVQPLFPELVGSISDPEGGEATLTLKYAEFGVLAIGGLRELKSETDAISAKLGKSIRALQGRVKKLEKQLAQS